MATESKIDINTFKVVTMAIAESDDLRIMADYLTQLLVGAMEIKGCTLFALNSEANELEILSSFGMSLEYMNKGPVVFNKSLCGIDNKNSIVIRDIKTTDLLQYPEHAIKEGIGAIVSVPILLYGDRIGALRLYHHDVWDIADQDVESLLILAEIIGLAMMYARGLNALRSIKETISAVPLELPSNQQ